MIARLGINRYPFSFRIFPASVNILQYPTVTRKKVKKEEEVPFTWAGVGATPGGGGGRDGGAILLNLAPASNWAWTTGPSAAFCAWIRQQIRTVIGS
jgi:hypothetical protein